MLRTVLPALAIALAGCLPAVAEETNGGQLRIIGDDGKVAAACPLEHTDVEADIVGFVARVTVRQVFHNPTDTKVEAIYTFPLPQNAAVDDMVMVVGEQRIVGQIHERGEARQIYEAARDAGHVTSLLDQERPNIFTQSVANIEPGAEVVIEISFTETLKFEDGVYEWVFPMVVGPRYIPGGGSAPAPMSTGQPTPQVPDADRITPPVIPEGMRAGHDVSLTANLDAGIEIFDLESVLHDVEVSAAVSDPTRATIQLADRAVIPNKDFILRYRLSTDEIGDAFLTHTDERGTFFTLLLQPPRRVEPTELVPRELVFVLDTSGSMRGFPIDKAKELMSRMVDTMRPDDTFNLITFAGHTSVLWNEPRPNTKENRAAAQQFLASHSGGGGTEMMKAIEAALVQQRPPIVRPAEGGAEPVLTPAELSRGGSLDGPVTVRVRSSNIRVLLQDGMAPGLVELPTGDGEPVRAEVRHWTLHGGSFDPESSAFVEMSGVWEERDGKRVFVADHAEWPIEPPDVQAMRVVIFMTDGYVGNDMAIIDAVRRNADTTRVFSFGIGNSVNRYLLDGMASAGRGEVEYVTLENQADPAVERLYERLSAPVLTDIEIDFGDLPVSEVYPTRIPDLFSVKPVLVHGRLAEPSSGVVTLHGTTGAGPYTADVEVAAASRGAVGATETERGAIASLWARAKVEHLMNQDLAALQRGSFPEELKGQIVDLGVAYRLLTQFTSFVAVEEMRITDGGELRTIRVPVEMPDGVSYEGVFGEEMGFGVTANRSAGLQSLGYVGGVPQQAAGKAPPPPPAAEGGVVGRRRAEDGVFRGGRANRSIQQAGTPVREDAEREIRDEPVSPLADALRDLANRVENEGSDGDFKDGKIEVRDWRVSVMVTLKDLSDETRKALEELGFKVTSESRTVRLLVGSIDVRKLEQLAKLETVRRIEPLP